MYICDTCGAIFENPAKWGEKREFWGEDTRELFDGCPDCHSSYSDAMICKGCGEWVSEIYQSSGFCKKCLESLKEKLFDKLFEFSSDELEALSDVFDGEDVLFDAFRRIKK